MHEKAFDDVFDFFAAILGGVSLDVMPLNS